MNGVWLYHDSHYAADDCEVDTSQYLWILIREIDNIFLKKNREKKAVGNWGNQGRGHEEVKKGWKVEKKKRNEDLQNTFCC